MIKIGSARLAVGAAYVLGTSFVAAVIGTAIGHPYVGFALSAACGVAHGIWRERDKAKRRPERRSP